MTRVKKLEWRETQDGHTCKTVFGEYATELDDECGWLIYKDGDDFDGRYPGEEEGFYTEAEAMRAVEDLCRSRILACVEPPTVAEAARACSEWAEVSQRNYQKAKRLADLVKRLLPIARHYGGLSPEQSATIHEAEAALRALAGEGKP